MGAAVRDLEVAINWRVTLLGLNLAAWLVLALIVAALFVRRDLAGTTTLAPGFGSIPMFDDVPAFYPARTNSEPAVGLGGIARLEPTGLEDKRKASLGQRKDGGLSQPQGLGAPRRLAEPQAR